MKNRAEALFLLGMVVGLFAAIVGHLVLSRTLMKPVELPPTLAAADWPSSGAARMKTVAEKPDLRVLQRCRGACDEVGL